MFNKSAELIEQKYLERARNLSVALLCDGVKKANIDLRNNGCMEAAIKPVAPGMTMVGTALTVQTGNGDNFPIHLATYSAPSEGYVMVIDGKGFESRAYCGDLIMGACQAIGFEGMVVDGYTRDREGNIKLGFPVYSKGFIPNSPIKKDEGNVNTEIFCGGVKVNPGDLVAGDSDGVCVIPREYIGQVLDLAEEKLAYEIDRSRTIEAYREAKRNGKELPQLAPQWVLDMIK
ncbi:RraA family protein [Lacrimispora sp. JR3]|uniref:RraA family protein n=1 Tax=Lacrimispora sinapis TaxID=3111456 RepID=UPI0037492CBA